MEEKIKIYSLYLPFGIVGIWRNNQNNTTIYKLAISENFDGPIHSRDLHAFIIFDIKPCLIPFLIASIKGCINHPNGIEDILFAHREGEIEFIRHDLFMTLIKNKIDLFGLIDRCDALDLNILNEMHARVNKEIIPEEELENAFGEKMTEHQIRREIILASLVNICRGSQVASK